MVNALTSLATTQNSIQHFHPSFILRLHQLLHRFLHLRYQITPRQLSLLHLSLLLLLNSNKTRIPRLGLRRHRSRRRLTNFMVSLNSRVRKLTLFRSTTLLLRIQPLMSIFQTYISKRVITIAGFKRGAIPSFDSRLDSVLHIILREGSLAPHMLLMGQ